MMGGVDELDNDASKELERVQMRRSEQECALRILILIPDIK